jgi:hypothetical protein
MVYDLRYKRIIETYQKKCCSILKNCDKKTTNDIIWLGSADGNYAITWNELEKIASATKYGQTGIAPK